MRDDLPTGTVTFLFTDVEGSTNLLHELGSAAYADALAEHRRVVREACAAKGGVEVDTQGDAFFLAFPSAPGAANAAQAITDALAPGPISLRIGLHTGTPLVTDEGYVGVDTHRAARITAAGHGGQVLISASTASLLDVELRDLGEHRFKDLAAAERVYQLGASEFPALKSLYRTNLPSPATPFLGRERELAEVVELLARPDTRLVTLTGPGGTGKTRLALQAAAELSERYPDGVWWVPLASLTNPAIVLEQAAQVLGAKTAVSSHIADKRLLLLFDNFEHVAVAGRDLAELLSSCSNLDVLVTSRSPLRTSAEREYPVGTLEDPEAVEFFLARAKAWVPSVARNGAVEAICRRLDGLPLALELAAARARAISPERLLERLETRLPLLTGGPQDAPERQRTLRSTIAWSYELLDDEEQRVFARLSVFAGGCSLDEAEALAQADVDLLQSLVETSLLRFADERYWMLQTIREFAREQLAELGELGRLEHSLAHHVAARINRVDPALVFFHDIANWRTALERALAEKDAELALALFMGSAAWRVRETEVLYWNDRVVADTRQTPEGRGLLLRSKALVLWILGDAVGAVDAAEEAVRLLREHGSPVELAFAVVILGLVLSRGKEVDRARQTLEEGLAIATTAADRRAAIWALHSRGELERDQGNVSLAQWLLESALAEAAAAGQPMAPILQGLGDLALDRGKTEEAMDCYVKGWREATKTRHPVAIFCAAGIAAILAAEGRIVDAGRLWGASHRMAEQIGHIFGGGAFALEVQRYEALLPSPDDTEFAKAVAEGRAEDPLRIIDAALSTLD